MKFAEIKDLTVEELRKRLATSKSDLFEMKMKHSLGQIGNPLEIKGTRRDLARVQTALNQKLSK